MFQQLGYLICIPFAWLTRMFYSLTGSYGVTLILFTLVVKVVLLPFQLKSKKSMLRMNRMQSKVKEIQARYANDQTRQQQEISALYTREGVNPMSGCLWSLLPFPILIALYYIIRLPLRYLMMLTEESIGKITALATSLGYVAADTARNGAYEQIYLAKFIHEHWDNFAGQFEGLIDLDYSFLGLDLASTASTAFKSISTAGWAAIGLLLLPLISTAVQLLLMRVTMSASAGAEGASKTMMYMMPLMTLWMGFVLPAALCVYWIANSALSLLQELTLNKFFNKILDREETDREKQKRELRAAKMEAARAKIESQKGQTYKANKNTSKKKQERQKQQNATTENGRVGQRPYARGRSYDENHYND